MAAAVVRHEGVQRPVRVQRNAGRLKKCRQFYTKFSDVIASGYTASLNGVVLASRLIRYVPSFIPYLAQTALGYSGALWLTSMVKDLLKSCRDLVNAVKTKDLLGFLWVLFKIQFQVIDILCIPGGIAASIFGLCGRPGITMALYRIMRPFALYSIALSCLGQFVDYFANRRLIRLVVKEVLAGNDLEKRKVKADRFISAVKAACGQKGKISSSHKIDKLAVKVVRQLNTFSLKAFLKAPEILQLDKINSQRELVRSLYTNLECSQFFTVRRLRLIVFDYALLSICKMYPQTILQASLIFGRSLIAFKMTLSEKLRVTRIYRSKNAADHPRP